MTDGTFDQNNRLGRGLSRLNRLEMNDKLVDWMNAACVSSSPDWLPRCFPSRFGFRALLILRYFSFKVLGFVQCDQALHLYPFGRLDFVKLKD